MAATLAHDGGAEVLIVEKADMIGGTTAAQAGIDVDGLEATVAGYNEHAARGEDPDFDRHRVGLMAPGQVAPIVRPSFYAVAMYPGMLGTNGGPRLSDRCSQGLGRQAGRDSGRRTSGMVRSVLA